jgi:hypothetical protein
MIYKAMKCRLDSNDENLPLRATDFGISIFYKLSDVFKDFVGCTYYMALVVL